MDFRVLIDRYISGSLTTEEQRRLLSLMEQPSYRSQLEEVLRETMYTDQYAMPIDADYTEQFIQQLSSKIHSQSNVHRVHFLRTAWFRYAAAVLFILGTGGTYLWLQQSRPQTVTSDNKYLSADINPGRNGAILTLADGSEVVLDSLSNGIIATQNGLDVLLKDGQLVYDPTGGDAGTTVAYNTMSTPKGRQFNVLLPDGTRVWLNAASSLRYPMVFGGKERRVEITGEAYFEVVKDTKKPFFVTINNETEVEVLGTSFNVNAYDNESVINTTLIDGSVRVAVNNVVDQKTLSGKDQTKVVVLKPGQQAQVTNAGDRSKDMSTGKTLTRPGITVNDVDTDKVIAWKNGVFNFNGVGLEEAMRQLERWYGIQVVYESTVPNIRFGGEMSRDVSLEGLLKLLSGAQLKFRIEEGKKLVVLP